jgi:hypothetical protein
MRRLVVTAVALVATVSGCAGGSGSSGAPTSAPTPSQKAQFELVVSQSSCQESPSNASVNCSIGVKNRGATAGLPTVYADYFYDDGGESADESDNGQCVASDPIPAGELGFVYFCHTYNATQHDVIRVAVSLNESATAYPYVRVAAPGDVNWPNG